jgi:hypothetical protein
VAFVLAASAASAALAQTPPDPNPGALTVTGGLDVPSVYVFRGLVQESDPKITLFPYVDVGVRLTSGDGAIKNVSVNAGLWNSLNTGSSGSSNPALLREAHYEEDFYATVTVGLGAGISVTPGYMALTSPNAAFLTIKELQLKVTKASWLNPYAFLAFELTDRSADGGARKGTYLELGAAPAVPLGTKIVTLAVPVKVGVSANNYYELNGVDRRFGFFDVGGLLTLPLKRASGRFGAWNIHGGVDAIVFGDKAKAVNAGESRKIVALGGIGFSY